MLVSRQPYPVRAVGVFALALGGSFGIAPSRA
jgi:hypothetical protein